MPSVLTFCSGNAREPQIWVLTARCRAPVVGAFEQQNRSGAEDFSSTSTRTSTSCSGHAWSIARWMTRKTRRQGGAHMWQAQSGRYLLDNTTQNCLYHWCILHRNCSRAVAATGSATTITYVAATTATTTTTATTITAV